jgi:PPOX class probable F420-dependent enzyme
VTADEARRHFAAARVARLATADSDARPHLVPIVFAVAGETVYSAVDHKPKRSLRLRRLANVLENPAVALLADHYDEDWDALWWVRADGTGRVLDPGDDEARRAVALLRDRYAPYAERPPTGPVLAVDVTRWSGWSAQGHTPAPSYEVG